MKTITEDLKAISIEMVSSFENLDSLRSRPAKEEYAFEALKKVYLRGMKSILKVYEDFGIIKISPAQDRMKANFVEAIEELNK